MLRLRERAEKWRMAGIHSDFVGNVKLVAPKLLHRTDARISHMAEIGPLSRAALG